MDDAEALDRTEAAEANEAATPAGGPAGAATGERFALGSVLAGRYRILGPLGRGGMGEVYRAEDLKLDQAIALKFRPRGASMKGEGAEWFLSEVRLAREIAHPNVCRIYDIVDSGPDQFIAMEYVDGEDLAGLLKRIGRLPVDKALDVARQLCAGLAAIHDRGVLHRDLKPANVMLDGRGRVRITDFGIAASTQAKSEKNRIVGTPAYMAPEQIAGLGATAQSDIYALGLILYEVFTGRHPFPAESLAEMLSLRQAGLTTKPTTLVTEMPPLMEQVIVRCLDPDPARRPSSVVAVAAALPGGDPLAAALAAGQTPSPEMVAQAGRSGALRPRLAVGGFFLFLALLGVSTAIDDSNSLLRKIPINKPPAAQVDRAREILKKHGHGITPDHAVGRYISGSYPSYLAKKDKSAGRIDKMARVRPWTALFEYREGPDLMLPRGQKVTRSDPAMVESGMSRLVLDLDGRLVSFEVVAPVYPDSVRGNGDQEWSAFFEEAGLRIEDFRATRPFRRPDVPADRVLGWSGIFPEEPSESLHVTAASYEGRPVCFALVGNWEGEGNDQAGTKVGGMFKVAGIATVILLLSFLLVILFIVYLAYRRGKGDRRLAKRIALYMLGTTLVGRILGADCPPGIGALAFVPAALKSGLLTAAIFWLLYLALEPLARRYWPHAIISWTRLTSGRLRDPLVGRDILLGSIIAVLSALLQGLSGVAPRIVGAAPTLGAIFRRGGQSLALDGGRGALGTLFAAQPHALAVSFAFFFLYLVPRRLIRRRAIAIGLTALVFALPISMGAMSSGTPWLASLLDILSLVLLLAGMIRFGVLVTLIAMFVADILTASAITCDFSRWYAGTGMIYLAAVVLLAAFGAHVALAGQQIFKDEVHSPNG